MILLSALILVAGLALVGYLATRGIRPEHTFYEIRDLGPVNQIFDLNDRGEVVGQSTLTGPHAFVWSATEGLKEIRVLGYERSFAYRVNNLGQILIMAFHDPQDKTAFFLTNVEDQDTLIPIEGVSQIRDLILLGQFIIGEASGSPVLLKFENGTFVPQECDFSEVSIPITVNDVGGVVGIADSSSEAILVYRDPGGIIHRMKFGVSPTPRFHFGPTKINNNGWVVAFLQIGGGGRTRPIFRSFLWDPNGPLVELHGPCYGLPTVQDLNDRNQAVGVDFNTREDSNSTVGKWIHWAIDSVEEAIGFHRMEEESRAILWEDGVGYDLNDLILDKPDPVILTSAIAINNRGQIAAMGIDGPSRIGGFATWPRGYLLTPVEEIK